MVTIHKTLLFVTSVIALSLLVFPVFAQVAPIAPGGNCGFVGMSCTGGETFSSLATQFIFILNLVVIWLLRPIAIAYLVYAGFLYITSRGNPEQAEQAKRQAAFALLGLILVLIAGVIVDAVIAVDLQPVAVEINALIDLALQLVSVIAAGYIIYAGFRYITSRGDEEATVTAKRSIVFALIGIFVTAVARIAVTAVADADTTVLIIEIRTIINAVLTLLGLLAAVYVVLGGVMYIMSQGDQDKASRAKMQIIYALLGIAIVSLSALLVNFIIDNI